MSAKLVYIYILGLQHGKYYIGKTTNPDFRIKQHFNGNACLWTTTYFPSNVIEIIPNCNAFDEDKYTLMYMEKYGIDNVRGGSYCQINLDENDRVHLQRCINSATDLCYKCGKKGHFSKNCKDLDIADFEIIHEKKCSRCYRDNHTTNQCYAYTYENGTMIDDSNYLKKIYELFNS